MRIASILKYCQKIAEETCFYADHTKIKNTRSRISSYIVKKAEDSLVDLGEFTNVYYRKTILQMLLIVVLLLEYDFTAKYHICQTLTAI